MLHKHTAGGDSRNQPRETTKDSTTINLGGAMFNANSLSKKQHHRTPDTSVRNQEANRPVAKETQQVDTIRANNERIEAHYDKLLQKDWGLFERLRDGKMYQVVMEEKEKLFTASAKYRLAFHQTLLETKLQLVTEKCNSGVALVKGHYRKEVATFLMTKLEELTLEVKERQFTFLNSMRAKYEVAAGLADIPSLQEKYLSSIFNEETRYLGFLDDLLDKFGNITAEEIKKYE